MFVKSPCPYHLDPVMYCGDLLHDHNHRRWSLRVVSPSLLDIANETNEYEEFEIIVTHF